MNILKQISFKKLFVLPWYQFIYYHPSRIYIAFIIYISESNKGKFVRYFKEVKLYTVIHFKKLTRKPS